MFDVDSNGIGVGTGGTVGALAFAQFCGGVLVELDILKVVGLQLGGKAQRLEEQVSELPSR